MKATATEGQESSIVTDYTLKLLGLDICADTMVGDEMLRGISGGQRKQDIKGWWIWGYWVSPIMYGTTALMGNEFLGNSWHNATNNLGVEFLESRGFFSDSYWYWLGFGAVAGFVFLLNMLFGFALEFLGREYFLHHLYFKILSEMQGFINKYASECAAFEKPQATITEEEPEANTPSEGTVAEVELPRIESSGRADSVVESSHGKKKGMVLPFEPHSITFDEVVYSVDMPQGFYFNSTLARNNLDV
ncbi:ABC transporter G family member 40 [Spatholobus suberectus]|nr:ABC transporter G family member 40 [Spatholobus suberectus]